jgi:hypothetical protein
MTDATEKVSERVENGKTVVTEAGLCTFSVEEAFKGVTATELKIYVQNWKGTSCAGTGFVRGVKYIFYASYSASSGLSIGPCNPTRTLEYSKEALNFLRNLPKAGVGGRLYGQVGVEKGSGNPAPMAGITIIAKNEFNQEVKATTNTDGYYEMTGLKPGHYRVEPVLPEHHDVYEPERKVEVSDRGCVQINYWLEVEGSLSGRVVDSQGRTAPANLRLVSVGDEEQRLVASAENDGEFELGGIPPGRYLLYLDVISAGKNESSGKEEKYFYPGTFERQEAKIIEIKLGEQLEDYGFTLPVKLKVQFIQGAVKYADGKPAARARLMVSIKDRTTPGIYRTDDYLAVETDEEGRFEIHGFKGNTYEITAQEEMMTAIMDKRRGLYSEPLTVKLHADTKDIRLSLTTTESPVDRMRKSQPPTKQ